MLQKTTTLSDLDISTLGLLWCVFYPTKITDRCLDGLSEGQRLHPPKPQPDAVPLRRGLEVMGIP